MDPLMKDQSGRQEIGQTRAQSALEYIILTGAVVVVVLLAFKTLLPKVGNEAEQYFNMAACGIYGLPAMYNESGNLIDRSRQADLNYP